MVIFKTRIPAGLLKTLFILFRAAGSHHNPVQAKHSNILFNHLQPLGLAHVFMTSSNDHLRLLPGKVNDLIY